MSYKNKSNDNKDDDWCLKYQFYCWTFCCTLSESNAPIWKTKKASDRRGRKECKHNNVCLNRRLSWIVCLRRRFLYLNGRFILFCARNQRAIELSSELDLAGKQRDNVRDNVSVSGILWLSSAFKNILSPIKIWSTVAVSQCRTGNDCAHNSAEKLIKEHYLPLEISLKRSWPWWLLAAIDKIAFSMITLLNYNEPTWSTINQWATIKAEHAQFGNYCRWSTVLQLLKIIATEKNRIERDHRS